MKKLISIIVPVYNERLGIKDFVDELEKIISPLNARGYDMEIIFIDDGSRDGTFDAIRNISNKKIAVKGLSFSRNFGKDIALTAGLRYAKGDAVIPVDVDLQDPPELFIELVDEWEKGFKVVLAEREKREGETFIKKLTAKLFYKVFNFISEDKLKPSAGDFLLLDRIAVDAINEIKERNRFMKMLFHWHGFETSSITYVRRARVSGDSKWNYWKLWNFAIDGLTSSSTVPLRIWSYLGGGIAFLSFMYALFIIIKTIFFGVVTPGYASLLVAILCLGGLQLLSIGVIGEYLARIFTESKGRPLYYVKEYIKLEPIDSGENKRR